MAELITMFNEMSQDVDALAGWLGERWQIEDRHRSTAS